MQLIEQLRSRLIKPLPGINAQYEMAPLGRAEMTIKVPSYKEAAVLCLLYPRNNDWHLVFIKRTSHEKDKHSAQIAFPGGKREASDQSLVDTAIREAHEEISLDPNQVNILGALTPLKIPVSKFEVFPYIAYSESTPIFKRQESEVEEIIEMPINMIINPDKKFSGPMSLSNGIMLEDVPQFDFQGNIVWGATSMMLNEIIHLLR